MMPFRVVAALRSPAGKEARLSTFIFHRVLSQADPLRPDEPDAAQFDRVIGWISALFNVLPLDEAVVRLRAGTLPSRAAAISFDDGYADNHDLALPVLLKHGISAAFFIATGYSAGGMMWNDTVIEAVRRAEGSVLDLEDFGLGRHSLRSWPERRGTVDALLGKIKYLAPEEREQACNLLARRVGGTLPAGLMMTPEQILALRRAGMVIGAHTRTHPIIAKIGLETVRREFSESRTWLEDLLGERLGLCAYPNGKPGMDYRPEHPDLLRELGFDAAFTTAWGTASRAQDPMQLPRFTPWDKTRLRFAVRCLENMPRDGDVA